MSALPAIVIATPHRRGDVLEQRLRERLPSHTIVRVRAREELSLEALTPIAPEYVFFPHWSWLIPAEIHTRFECVIFHMTDLPFGRGGSPLQNLIVRGHTTTVVSALKCVAGLDAGPIYEKRPLSLEGTAEEILQRGAAVVEAMILDMVIGRPVPVPQQGEVVEFKRRRPADGDLAPLESPAQAYDFIRMLDGEGYPPAFLDTAHLHLEFSGARLADGYVDAHVRIRRKTDV